MGDCQLRDLWASAVPETASVLSTLPLGCIYSVSPPNLWGLWGRWGLGLLNTVTGCMPAMSDMLGFTFPLIQTRSSLDPFIALHNRFQGIKILTQMTGFGAKIQMKHIK